MTSVGGKQASLREEEKGGSPVARSIHEFLDGCKARGKNQTMSRIRVSDAQDVLLLNLN